MRKFQFSLVLSFLCLLSFNTQAQDDFSGVFQQTTSSFEYAKAIPWQAIQMKNKELQKKGYRLVDIETVYNEQQQNFWGIWEKKKSITQVDKIKSWRALIEKKKAMAQKGFFLTDVESYVTNAGNTYFLGIWEKGAKGHQIVKTSSWKGVNQIAKKFEKQFLYLQDVEVYKDADNTTKFVMLFHKGLPQDKTYVYLSPNRKTFLTQRLQRWKSGFRMLDYERFMDNGKSIMVGVFKKGSGQETLQDNLNNGSFTAFHQQLSGEEGLQLTDIEIFEGKGFENASIIKKVSQIK